MEKAEKCLGCNNFFNSTNWIKLSCPACENFDRWAECFKKLKYECQECTGDWSIRDGDKKVIGFDQLDSNSTYSSKDLITIKVISEKGNKKEYKVNKHKKFKVLIAQIKYKLLTIYRSKQDLEYFNKKLEEIEKGKGFNLRFFHGEHELLETTSLASLGDGATVNIHPKYAEG